MLFENHHNLVIQSYTIVNDINTKFLVVTPPSIYQNASLCHLTTIIIVSGGTPVRYIVISALERRECATIYMILNPNHPLLRIWTATRNFARIPVQVMANLFPFISTRVLT